MICFFIMCNNQTYLKNLFFNNFSVDFSSYFLNQDIFNSIVSKILSHVDNKATKTFSDQLQACDVLDGVFSVSNTGVVCSQYESIISQKPIDDLAYYLRPWRKGPFQLGDLFIDSEWQSQMKWDRLAADSNFLDKTVLDVGCGNGYYLYRLLAQNVKFAFGLDPHLLYAYQFLFINRFIPQHQIGFLPLGWQDCVSLKPVFDYVLCLGVLYHQKDPFEVLSVLKSLLNDSGSLILETLVLDIADEFVLYPEDRYACMRNVYAIPAINVLKQWLIQVGFSVVDIIDVSKTTIHEQRSTIWSSSHSLINFLDSDDDSKTIEGYPAPVRAIMKVSL